MPTLTNAYPTFRQRLLKEGGVLLPDRAELFIAGLEFMDHLLRCSHMQLMPQLIFSALQAAAAEEGRRAAP